VRTNTETAVEVGHRPTAVAAGAGAVWVANAGSASVSRVDTRTRRVTEFTLDVSPDGIAFADGLVWVSGFAEAS
jgi:DNA-binding beta-propeller fold protein YncE